jgi:ABC-type multidrug transport system fused ATPase/permease subunit
MKYRKKIFDSYYHIKKFERDGTVYEKMGIKAFKKILLSFAENKRKQVPFQNYFLKEKSIEGMKQFEKLSRKSERSHLFIALIMFVYIIWIAFSMDSFLNIVFLLFFLLFNILVNIYPICLQRYHRIRINKVLARIASRVSNQ